MEWNWETILFAFAIIGYLNDVFDLADHLLALAKAIVKGVKWIVNQIRMAQKK